MNVCMHCRFSKKLEFTYIRMYIAHCNTYHFTDTNECLSSPCAHTCTNAVGSFVCSCDVGYILNSNQHSCDGMYLYLFTFCYDYNYAYKTDKYS